MKSTEKICKEIIYSIIHPLSPILLGRKLSAEEAKLLVDKLKKEDLENTETYQFIEFTKEHTLAFKTSYRCQRVAFYKFVEKFLDQLEKIGGYGKRYDKLIDEIIQAEKNSGNITFDSEGEKIFEMARKIKKLIEQDYEDRRIAVKERKKIKEGVKS